MRRELSEVTVRARIITSATGWFPVSRRCAATRARDPLDRERAAAKNPADRSLGCAIHRGHWQSDSAILLELTVLPASRRCRYPERLARLILVMALALYWAVSTGMWDCAHNAVPAEKRPRQEAKKVRPKPDILLHARYPTDPGLPPILCPITAALVGLVKLMDGKLVWSFSDQILQPRPLGGGGLTISPGLRKHASALVVFPTRTVSFDSSCHFIRRYRI